MHGGDVTLVGVGDGDGIVFEVARVILRACVRRDESDCCQGGESQCVLHIDCLEMWEKDLKY